MTTYFSKLVPGKFNAVISKVTAAFKAEGFGVLTDIDVASTLQEKIGVEVRPYRILGACNPSLAHRALEVENKIGTMLPCNVIVHDVGDGHIEVATINPVYMMEKVGNPALATIAAETAEKLERVIASL
jgi:uncharacterized protein (DUF302 family)